MKKSPSKKSRAIVPEVVALEQPEPELLDDPDVEVAGLPAVIKTTLGDDETNALVPSDPLKRYLREIQRYALLDPEQELELVQRLGETGDVDVARRLVTANLRLVVKIAYEYQSIYANILDLIQEGNIGLMKAVSRFDPSKGARLSYYASWWIRSYILKYILDNFRLVKVGTTQAQKKLFYHLVREKERLEAQGLLAGPKLLADRLNVREKDIVEMQQRLSSQGAEMSLDQPVKQGESQARHMYFIEDRVEGPDERLAHDELLGKLKEVLPLLEKTLNEKERQIMTQRLLSDEPRTLQEVADLYGLTRERVRQIEAKVIGKLRKMFEDSVARRSDKGKRS